MTAPDLTPREAVRRWLDSQRVDKREATLSAYWYRLKHFVEWCSDQEIATINELRAWDLNEYETHRRGEALELITLSKELGTLRQFVEYCVRIGLVADGIEETIVPASVPPADQVSSTRLDAEAAQALIETYRAGGVGTFRRGHVFLELAWYTAARLGALRGLDVGDVDTETGEVRFRHRPDSETPLKNGPDGERTVIVPDAVMRVVERYVADDRHDVTDDYGRHPLFTTDQGRAAATTLREDCYFASVPCRWRDCPHGKHQPSCEWFGFRRASPCPSSRSPHQIRTGAITWAITREVPIEIVAERANASPEVIRRHYDLPDTCESIERQAPYLSNFRFTDEDE